MVREVVVGEYRLIWNRCVNCGHRGAVALFLLGGLLWQMASTF